MKNLFISIIIVFLSCPLLMAQLSDSNTEAITEYFQITQNEKVLSNATRTKIDQNKASYVSIIQTGNENNVKINSLQTGDEQMVSQTGQQNNYEYYNYYSNKNSSMQVNQEGTLNSLQIFGENSLMKDAKINQKSDFKSLVVKNYTK